MKKLLAVLAVLVGTMVAPAVGQAQNVLTLHCKYSHSRQADPIVSYGVFPSAHLHDFIGSNVTDENSTADQLVGSTTSCKTVGDTAGYWFPQPVWTYGDGRVVAIKTTQLGEYWQRPTGVTVKAPPHGMEFVAGNSHAASEADNPLLTWTCGNGTDSAAPRDCTSSTGGSKDVVAVLKFPVCWDGTTAFDGQGGAGIAPSHFSYASSKCPSGLVQISKLVTHTHFLDPRTGQEMVNPFNEAGQIGLSFTSGPYYTYHGDFFNGWDQGRLSALIDGCVNKVGICPTHA